MRKRATTPIDSIAQRTEAKEQEVVVDWAWTHAKLEGMPSLQHLYAIPNGAWLGANRNQARNQAIKLKRQGLKPGMPDLCLPVAWPDALGGGGYRSLYIEMKRRGGDWTLTGEQLARAKELTFLGHAVVLCQGSDAAIMVLCQWTAHDPRLKDDLITHFQRGYARYR